jgi:hypothetical protein
MTTVKKPKKPRSNQFVPTSEQRMIVAMGVACGMPRPELLKRIINPHTKLPLTTGLFYRYFKDEIQNGDAVLNAQVAENMFRYATTRNNQAVIAGKFWLTHKAGWKPASAESEDSGKITIEVVNRLPD